MQNIMLTHNQPQRLKLMKLSSSLWMYVVLVTLLSKCRRTVQTPSSTTTSSSFSTAVQSCGGYLNASHGIIQTPNFPNAFSVPIECTWVIDASDITIANPNMSIIVYLTQAYTLSGLTFSEYMYYEKHLNIPSQSEVTLTEQEILKTPWIKFNSPFLEIKFTLSSLYGTHLRALNRLMDVYGFNITYEVGVEKQYTCSALACRFLGNCYAKKDFSAYYCDCPPNYHGIDCGFGPMCREKNHCQNGGECKHIGAAETLCRCPPGFKGDRCQYADIDSITGCDLGKENGCFRQCIYTGRSDDVCNCDQSISSSSRGGARYAATVCLAKSTHFYKNQLNENVSPLLKEYVIQYMKNYNISKINDLEVISGKPEQKVTFQFFGARAENMKIKEAFDKLVAKEALGNFSLRSTCLDIREESGLMLQSVVVNQKTAVREGTEFILSCVAQGSSTMSFRWYKNGYFVNVTKATRNMWTRLLPLDSRDHYTALLGITKASLLDDGVYTCQVNDMGMQQCRSTTVQILGPPQIRVEPSSVTINRGESILLRCLSAKYDQVLGYSWTKNGALFQSNPRTEYWEDLSPGGSALRIINIQKSAIYSCVVSNIVAPVSKSVHITVVEPGSVTLCPKNETYNVSWPASAAGPTVLIKCPSGKQGLASRVCEQRDIEQSEWLTPDFSNCVADEILHIKEEYQGLTFGYQKTNGSNVLQMCLEFAMKHYTGFLPGEGGFLLDLLYDIFQYVQKTGTLQEQEIAADIILRISDIIMQNNLSLNSQQQIKKLQELIQEAASNREATIVQPISSSSSMSSSSSKVSLASTTATHQLNSFYLYTESVKSLPYTMQIYGDQLYSDTLYMELDSSLSDIMSNGTVLVTVVSYKNLTTFLPKHYFARSSQETDIEFKPASKIISTWLYYANRSNESTKPLQNIPFPSGRVEIIFQHEHSENSEWEPLCGFDAKATFEPTWRTDSCMTENFMENVTRCTCPLSGTFVVLLAKKTFHTPVVKPLYRPIIVIISCGCCFLQSFIAFAILLPILYNRKCCVTFLKMQFCSATSTGMALVILGLLELMPQEWYGVITSILSSILLLSSSTLIAITVLVQTELGPRKLAAAKSLLTGIKGSIGLSWLLPILFTMSTLLVYNTTSSWPKEWWLKMGTFSFVLFIIIELLFLILFLLLFVTLMKKLLYLAKKHDKHNTSILKRIGLLYRTGFLFVSNIVCHIFYVVYLNGNRLMFLSYIFSGSCILLGFSILFCFVIKAEIKLDSESNSSKSSTKNSLDENFHSGSINSPLNCKYSDTISTTT